jgi:hypothetical protein
MSIACLSGKPADLDCAIRINLALAALELAKTGVNCTEMTDRGVVAIVEKTDISQPDARKSLAQSNPQDRPIAPDAIMSAIPMSAIPWLCGDTTRSVNGQAVTRSGGAI